MQTCTFKKIILSFTIMSFSTSSFALTPVAKTDYQSVIDESNLQIYEEKKALANFYLDLKEQLIEYKNLVNNRSDLRKKSLLAVNLTASIMGLATWAKTQKKSSAITKLHISTAVVGMISFIGNSVDTLSTAPSTEGEYIQRMNSIGEKIEVLNADNSLNPEVTSSLKSVLDNLQSFVTEQYLVQSNLINISDKRRLALYTKEAAVRTMLGLSALALFTAGGAGFFFAGYFAGNALAMVSLVTSFVYDDVEDLNSQIDEMLLIIDNSLLTFTTKESSI